MPKFIGRAISLTLVVLLSSHAAAEEKPDAPRFIDRGKYVEDTKTGLLWQKDGNESGKKNFQQAAEYAKKLRLGGMSGWRVPTRDELAEIFPATEKPFTDTKYTEQDCCGGPHKTDTYSYWTGEWANEARDYAWIYQWYADGGANNCIASKNLAYILCVHDSLAKTK